MLSVLLPTFNNEKTIGSTLDSVRWADEILVVDSFSTDGTLDICRKYGARIIQHEYVQSAKQKNWAIPQCAHEWVLQMDTDEVLEEQARTEIEKIIAAAPPNLHAYRIPRKNYILGVWLQVCALYPDYQTRLFRRDVGRFADKEVHAKLQAPGQIGTLQHHLLHYGMESIGKQLSNMDRYARYQADELKKQGKRFHWYDLVLRPIAIFAYCYFRQMGFTAGYRGFLVCAIKVTFDFWAHAKLWEIEALELAASPK